MTREPRPVALALLAVLWALLPLGAGVLMGVAMYAVSGELTTWGRVLYAIPAAVLGFVLALQPTAPVISHLWGRLTRHLKTTRKDQANG